MFMKINYFKASSTATATETVIPTMGERPDRRRWRMKGGERVAAVGEGRRCIVTKDIRRAPQQGIIQQPAARQVTLLPNGRKEK